MLTPLFKKSKHVGIVEFLVTVAFGFVGLLIVLMESFPKSLVWLLSPFCQCTFLIGIAQVGNIHILLSLNIFFSLHFHAAYYTTMNTALSLQKKLFKIFNMKKEWYLNIGVHFILVSFIFSPFFKFFYLYDLFINKFSTFHFSVSQ